MISNNCTWEKWNGTTLDGQNPCCPCCDPPGECFEYQYPPPNFQPPTPPPRICPYPEPEWGNYLHQDRGKNFTKTTDDCKYCPGPCQRPCCRHYTSKLPPCKYDDPCKAHCFNHPFGMQPSGRYPPNVYRGPLKSYQS